MRMRYSGDLSEAFWARVAKIKNEDRRSHIYELGCILQEMEGRVHRALEHAEEQQRAAPKRSAR